MNLRVILVILTGAHAMAGEKSTEISEPLAQGTWKVRSGVSWKRLGATSINPDFRGSLFTPNFFSPSSSTGAVGSPDNRRYDNGFVNQGAGTPATGLTPNWGYQSGSQITNQFLNFSASGGSALSLPSSGSDGNQTTLSPYLELAYLMPLGDKLDGGFSINFSFLDLESSIRNTITESSVTTHDSFTLTGITPPPPPYTGTFTGPGPLLENIPTSRSFTSSAIGTQDFLFESKTDLYSLSLGTEVNWQIGGNFSLGLGAGVTLNYADWHAQVNVPLIAPGTSIINSTRFSNSEDEFLWGAYLKLASTYRFSEHWSAEGFFRYDWNEALTAKVGPTSFKTDLTGWNLGLGLSYLF